MFRQTRGPGCSIAVRRLAHDRVRPGYCTGSGGSAATIRLDAMWRAQGLANPESAALSADRAFLYVSNVNGEGEAKDQNGFIARVGLDGRILERDWARGLNAPKGIMLRGESLYVADIDEMVVIDAGSGAVTRRVAAPGALFLNDLAFAPDGRVLIADSQNRASMASAPIRPKSGPRMRSWTPSMACMPNRAGSS